MKKNDFTDILVSIGMVAIAIVFTWYGFFSNQVCDIDRQYLFCRLHPFTTGDLIGCIFFYSSLAIMGGITRLFGWNLYNAPNSSGWTIGTVILGALGAILIWNL